MSLEFFPFVPMYGQSVPGNENHIAAALGTGVFVLYLIPNANCVVIQATDQNIRYTLNGQDPTATFGFQLRAGDSPMMIAINPNVVLKFFREASRAYLQAEFGKNALGR